MTACLVRPVRISLPAMITGISIADPVMSDSVVFNAARSGEPGA